MCGLLELELPGADEADAPAPARADASSKWRAVVVVVHDKVRDTVEDIPVSRRAPKKSRTRDGVFMGR